MIAQESPILRMEVLSTSLSKELPMSAGLGAGGDNLASTRIPSRRISGLMSRRVPFIVAALGRDVDPFMLHIYARSVA